MAAMPQPVKRDRRERESPVRTRGGGASRAGHSSAVPLTMIIGPLFCGLEVLACSFAVAAPVAVAVRADRQPWGELLPPRPL